MSRKAKFKITAEEAFDAVCFFEETVPRDENEKRMFKRAVVAFRKCIHDREIMDRKNEYLRKKLAEDAEYARRHREYDRAYKERIRKEAEADAEE